MFLKGKKMNKYLLVKKKFLEKTEISFLEKEDLKNLLINLSKDFDDYLFDLGSYEHSEANTSEWLIKRDTLYQIYDFLIKGKFEEYLFQGYGKDPSEIKLELIKILYIWLSNSSKKDDHIWVYIYE